MTGLYHLNKHKHDLYREYGFSENAFVFYM